MAEVLPSLNFLNNNNNNNHYEENLLGNTREIV